MSMQSWTVTGFGIKEEVFDKASIDDKINFGSHFKSLLIFLSTSMYAEITVSPNCAKTHPENAIDKKGNDFSHINKQA